MGPLVALDEHNQDLPCGIHVTLRRNLWGLSWLTDSEINLAG